jgi:chaperonin cofactor prefoldin
MENKKLTEEELTNIQSMLNVFNQLKMQLGDVELSKAAIVDKVNELRDDYSRVEKELSEKYGADSKIDLQTGDVVIESKEENKLEIIK